MKLSRAIGFGSFVIGSLLAGCGGSDDAAPEEPGHAYTILGIPGEVGFNGDGHTALETRLYWTLDTEFTPDGAIWFLDWNNHIVRKLTPEGTVHTVVGFTDPIFPGDGDAANPGLEKTEAGAPGAEVQLNHPTGLHQTADGKMLLMAWHNHKLREIDPVTENVRIVGGAGAGFVDGVTVDKTLFKQPSRFAFDDQGNCYIVDQQNLRVRVIDVNTKIITTVAGNGTLGFSGDGGPATEASLALQLGDNPEPSGGIAIADGQLYLADTDNNRIRKVDLETGIITTIAGTGEGGFSGDGAAADSQLFHPRDLEIGPDGNLYVADTDNARIRMIDLATGQISTVVGTGTHGLDLQDGLVATETQLNRPFGIDFDLDGNLIVADTLNSRLLRVAK